MRFIEQVQYDRCHHLDRSKCVQRKFYFFNQKKAKHQEISICTDLASILYKDFIDSESHYFALSDLAVKIISGVTDYCEDDLKPLGLGKEVVGDFHYKVCDRPYLWMRSNIRDASEFFIKDFHRVFDFRDYWESYVFALRGYCNYQLRYKKYKYQHDKVQNILRRIEKANSVYLIDELTQLFIIILQLKINKSIKK